MLARSWPQLEQNCLSHSEMHSKDHVLSGNPNWFPCSPPPTSQRQNVSQRFPARNSGPIWTRIKTSGAGERAQWLRVLAAGVGDLAQWQSTCLASTRPWVRSSALEKEKRNSPKPPTKTKTKTGKQGQMVLVQNSISFKKELTPILLKLFRNRRNITKFILCGHNHQTTQRLNKERILQTNFLHEL